MQTYHRVVNVRKDDHMRRNCAQPEAQQTKKSVYITRHRKITRPCKSSNSHKGVNTTATGLASRANINVQVKSVSQNVQVKF